MPGRHAAQTVVRLTRSDVLTSGSVLLAVGLWGPSHAPQNRAPIQAQWAFNAIPI